SRPVRTRASRGGDRQGPVGAGALPAAPPAGGATQAGAGGAAWPGAQPRAALADPRNVAGRPLGIGAESDDARRPGRPLRGLPARLRRPLGADDGPGIHAARWRAGEPLLA